MLPAASLSNVGIYGTGQAFEALLLRMRAHPLPEARAYADLMLHELRKVIPSFLQRVDLADRGGRWSDYLATHPRAHGRARRVAVRRRRRRPTPRRRCTLVDFDPDAEVKLLAAICYPHTDLPEAQIARPGPRHSAPTSAWRSCGPTSASGRTGGTSRAGRFERIDYRFDVLADYGAFRDLQRHRMLTIEWQPLTPDHGYVRPDARRRGRRRPTVSTTRWHRSAALYDALHRRLPGPGRLRRVAGLPGALRDAVQRPRGDAPARAAHRRPRATRPTARSPRRCTGSSPSRRATGPSPR